MNRPLRPNTTQVPDIIIDRWMSKLSGAEFKVLLYITRRTYGFQKEGDTISLKQIVSGITRRDGTQLDHGTGLNKDTVCKALNSLEERGFIRRQRREDETGDLPNFYSLNIDLEIQPEAVSEKTTGPLLKSNVNPVGKNDTPGVGKSRHGAVGKHDTPGVGKSETGVVGITDRRPSENTTQQQTREQETETTNSVVVDSLALTLLREAGFSLEAATEIASHPNALPENIQHQIEAMKRRRVTKNWHGLLRKAIEGKWTNSQSEVNSADQHIGSQKPKIKTIDQAMLPALEHRKRELKLIYDRVIARPDTRKSFMQALETERIAALNKPMAKTFKNVQKITDSEFQTEEKHLEVLEKLLGDKQSPFYRMMP